MNLFNIDKFKSKEYDWGIADEFFIFPVASTYEDKNFKIRIGRFDVKNADFAFEKFDGFKSFLVPLDKNFAVKYKNSKMLIKAKTTFKFMADEDLASMSEARVFNLMLADDIDGKVEVLKFFDKLLVEDSFPADKILFAYALTDDFIIRSANKETELKKDGIAILIPKGKYDFEIVPKSVNKCEDDEDEEESFEHAIIFGKVVL